MKQKSDDYPDAEAQARFEAALRGARVAGHKPMEAIQKKRAAKKRKAKKKPA